MNDERVAKYEAWVRELEARQRLLAATRGRWFRVFIALALVSPIGFVWNPWAGAATLFTGVMMSIFGFYTVLVREGDYERDLANARRDLNRLREGSR